MVGPPDLWHHSEKVNEGVGEKMASSTKGAGETGYAHMED
jgi:hypothetical protein